MILHSEAGSARDSGLADVHLRILHIGSLMTFMNLRPAEKFGWRPAPGVRSVSEVHEHMGQSISYARMIGVVPPWSEQAARPVATKT